MKTRRLVIRPYTLSDYETWKQGILGRLPKQNEFDPGPVPPTKINQAYFCKILKLHTRARVQDQLYVFGIFELRSKKCVGFIDIYSSGPFGFSMRKLGLCNSQPILGSGICKGGGCSSYSLGFKSLKLDRIEAGIDPKNKASVAVAKAIGMKSEGIRRSCTFEDGRWRDLRYYSIVPTDIRLKPCKPSFKTTLHEIL